MRGLFTILAAVVVSIAVGYVWGWQSRGEDFDRQKIALEASVRMREKLAADELQRQLDDANRRLAVAADVADRADKATNDAIRMIAKAHSGAPVSSDDLAAINRIIEEAVR